MAFPDSPRVIYGKSPLAEVICQLKFPPILRIDSEPPAGLQEAIRHEYPLYSEQSASPLAVPPNLPDEMAKVIQGLVAGRGAGVRHEFASEDRSWSVTLARDALALQTNSYRRWEEFRGRLNTLCRAFVAEYTPAFYTRVGLRYVDVIQRSKLGLGTEPWAHLLKPHIAAEFSANEIADRIETAARQVLVKLDDAGGRVTIRHGLAFEESTTEPCFVIDSDFHTEARMESGDAIRRLDEFNRSAGKLFRWCIHRRLHDAMDPQPAEV